MPQELTISDDDILYAQNILLDDGKKFDDERIAFIQDLRTLDLQAVPGSGKTTCLLAKLLIIERKLPFPDGSGILVISHTNAAIDEIRSKIQEHCPRLFALPNFIGTIQSFVDRFLAKPAYNHIFKSKLNWIDKQRYDEELRGHLRNIYWRDEFEELRKYLYSRHIGRADSEANGDKERKNYLVQRYYEDEVCRMFYDFSLSEIWCMPENTMSRKRLLKDDSLKSYEQLKQILLDVLKRGIASFDHAFYLAEYYVSCFSAIREILQKRFSYVFVDEMQDMNQLQHDLLEKLFFDAGNSSTTFQRIGDRNQSIYNHVQADDLWKDRADVLRLSGSHRLSKPIADVVQSFALYNDDDYEIVGMNDGTHKPHILVFDEKSVQNIIPYFGQIIKKLGIEDRGLPFKVVCWNTLWPLDDEKRNDPTKLRLEDYFPEFKKEKRKRMEDFDCLKSYLVFYEKTNTLKPLRDNILSALLKVLRLEEVSAPDGKAFTKSKLVNAMKERDDDEWEKLSRNLLNWSMDLVRGNCEVVWNEIKEYAPEFLKIFSSKGLRNSLTFLNADISGVPRDLLMVPESINRYIDGAVEIEIGSVHSVKGQTHCATLYLEYLESHYHNDAGNAYESQRLIEQFLGKRLDGPKLGQRVKESAKMAFVGFSRPTDLLCVAIHRERVAGLAEKLNEVGWEVVDVPGLLG